MLEEEEEKDEEFIQNLAREGKSWIRLSKRGFLLALYLTEIPDND